VNFRYTRDRDTVAEESLEKMSVAVENGVDASKTRGVFSRAFAKRAQPFEEGELFPMFAAHRRSQITPARDYSAGCGGKINLAARDPFAGKRTRARLVSVNARRVLSIIVVITIDRFLIAF